MFERLRNYIFTLYERPLLRNWFYTLAFAISVPVGLRLAFLAWEVGGDFDRLMTVVAGLAVGITTVVTLVRIWAVPPRQTLVPAAVPKPQDHQAEYKADASEIIAAIKACSARNRLIAQGARALGSPRTWRR
jgi:hypothetical protein